jgi:hypothetical protein
MEHAPHGGVWSLRNREFDGRRPYRFFDALQSPSGRWEMWMDAAQARAVRRAVRSARSRLPPEKRRADY